MTATPLTTPTEFLPRAAAGAPKLAAADLLTVGFGTTVLMWAVGYFCRLFGNAVPAPLLFGLLLLCLALGGAAAGRLTPRGIRGGLAAGAIAGLLNLLIVGSLISGDTPNSIRTGALLWVPGTLFVCMLVMTIGAALGSALRPAPSPDDADWPGAFASVAAAATFVLLAAGGLVTGFDEGLAVVDWPNSQGYNMFLYPLSRMTGGVYLEHSHRLLGSLVGITVMTLAIHTHLTERRRAVRWWMWLTFAAVVFQGILGGLRVTGRLTLSTNAADTAPNIVLAITHGVFGQMVFGALVALAVFRSRAWLDPLIRRTAAPGAGTDRVFTGILILALIIQLVLGALTRHFTWALATLPSGLAADPAELIALGQRMLLIHVTFAAVVVLVAVAAGVRAWGLYLHVAAVSSLGRTLLILTSMQIALGVAALIVTGSDAADRRPGAFDVAITTLHQIVGAALLACAVLLLLWNYRLLDDRASAQALPADAPPAVGSARD